MFGGAYSEFVLFMNSIGNKYLLKQITAFGKASWLSMKYEAFLFTSSVIKYPLFKTKESSQAFFKRIC